VKRPRVVAAVAGTIAFAAIAAGCASSTTQAFHDSNGALAAPQATVAPSSTTTTTVDPNSCNREASLTPDATIAPDSWMQKIRDRGRLIVGVDTSTRLFSFRDSRTGTIDGLDVDMLRAVARAIFGLAQGAPVDDKIDFRAVSTAERQTAIRSGDVDIVASLFTANCDRQANFGLSTVYFRSAQEVLVRDPSITSVDDLAGKKVCVTFPSTSYTQFRAIQPKAKIVKAAVRTDCLVALQDAQVDAVTADSTILEGFQSQDPTTILLPDPLSDEPYVIVVSKDHPEFVRFVNAVLQQMRDDGELAAIYQKWLGPSAPPIPQPTYRG
jgi:polar amino acid transport system substrate-binding protein